MKKTTLFAALLLCAMLLASPMPEAQASDPSIPKNLQLFNTDSGLHLVWDRVPGAISYAIYLDDGVTNQMIEFVPDDDSSPTIGHTLQSVGSMVEGKTYVLSVKANNSKGAASFGSFVYEIVPESGPWDEAPPDTGPYTPMKALLPAYLNQKMATRLGPGTWYSEVLGTFKKDTKIQVIEQVMGNGVPWGLVDFWSNGKHYRAYTGMKRISTKAMVPFGADSFYQTTLTLTTDIYYGPGYDYAKHKQPLFAGDIVRVFDSENGFYLCDFERDGTWFRGYVPASSF